MRIIIDTMGADKGIKDIVKGSLKAAFEKNFEPVFVGVEEDIENLLKEYNNENVKCSIIDAKDFITNEEEPAISIRRKKDSSMVKGLRALKEGQADAFLSCGSTGALLAGATLIVGRMKDVSRACIVTTIPKVNGNFVLADSGSNVDCTPSLLKQFAIMADVYSRHVLKKQNPKLYLLNIGVEENKGNELTKESYEILKESDLNFCGNIEARDVLVGDVDIVIADGFCGNILLKSIEGTAQAIMGILKEGLLSSFRTKLGAILSKPAFVSLKKKLDYREYGAAPILGVKKPVFKAHGSSDEKAIYSGLKAIYEYVEKDVNKELEEKLS